MLTCKINKEEKQQLTGNNVIRCVRHCDDDCLKDIKEGAEEAENNDE
jgi:hypothetical protein